MSREQDKCVSDWSRVKRIASLNDALRCHGNGGMIGVTRGVSSLPSFDPKTLLRALRAFDEFTPDNDPHGEHDFGKFTYCGVELFWKIDYFAPETNMMVGSPDPANPDVTERLLTVMLTGEY